ncbi:MAG TPA: hypothetical protein VFV73_18115 [Streptosporangiaceae bacterium]|nr:hypothetical protein [Streptosporangiaceae bacterium]
MLAGFTGAWAEPVLPALMAAGLTKAAARTEVRLSIAVIRGLSSTEFPPGGRSCTQTGHRNN